MLRSIGELTPLSALKIILEGTIILKDTKTGVEIKGEAGDVIKSKTITQPEPTTALTLCFHSSKGHRGRLLIAELVSFGFTRVVRLRDMQRIRVLTADTSLRTAVGHFSSVKEHCATSESVVMYIDSEAFVKHQRLDIEHTGEV